MSEEFLEFFLYNRYNEGSVLEKTIGKKESDIANSSHSIKVVFTLMIKFVAFHI